ncbi:MAG: GNAT family N-acetyltransferase [Lachnospiraceae bacterium]|nr:GNAT family N-acetyltransferase [Lachnospiraceae bacterium]
MIKTFTISGKTEKEFRLVEIGPEHVEQYLDFMHQVSSDSHFMNRYGDEVLLDAEAVQVERERIQAINDDDREIRLSVFDGEKIVGNIVVRRISKHRKTAHRCSIGIGIRKEYHGMGLGTFLMEQAVAFAKEAGYTNMELGVLSDNLPAQGLYKKMGFIECGRIPEAFRLDDGTTADEIVMYRKL